jgi:uncharacterized cupin superfamily protein
VSDVPEAPIERAEGGLVPSGPGWFVVNAREAQWVHTDELGSAVLFENHENRDLRFPQIGVNIQVLAPGEPNAMYHGENTQEDFLVLAGECLLLVEGEERPLKQWDFVHCPPWTEHVFVGAGDGPCAILMVGARVADEGLIYPRSEVALRLNAGVEAETNDGNEAYARFAEMRTGPYPEGVLPDSSG